MKIPTEAEEEEWCFHKYTNWRLLQRTDAKGNPALWAEYSVDNKPTLRGWVNNSGQVWVKKTGLIATIDADTMEAGPEMLAETPSPTFMWHLTTGAPKWSLERVLANPTIYGAKDIDLRQCGAVVEEHIPYPR